MSSSADRVEVLVGVQRRRRYTAEQKMAFVQEASQPGMTISYVARRHGIAPSLIFGWRRRMSEGGKEAVRADDEVVAKSELLALQKRVRELQRVLGKKTLENEILREAVKVAHEKKLISRWPSLPGEDLREAGRGDPGRLEVPADRAAERKISTPLELLHDRGCRPARAAA